MGMVVEGVATTKAAVELAQQLGVEMPITQTIYNVLYNGEDIKKPQKKSCYVTEKWRMNFLFVK